MTRENFFYAQNFQLVKRPRNSFVRRARQMQAANHGMNRQGKSFANVGNNIQNARMSARRHESQPVAFAQEQNNFVAEVVGKFFFGIVSKS